MALAGSAFAQPYEDPNLLRQLGLLAGEAVICQFDSPDAASEVMRRTADAMGYGDEESYAMLAEASRASQIGGGAGTLT